MGRTQQRLAQTPAAHVGRAEQGWKKVGDAVAAVPDAERQGPNVDLQLAGSVVVAAATTLRSAGYAGRLAKLVSIGEAPADLVDRAEELGWASIHARRRQLETTGSASEAKVPAKLAKESLAVRDRMFKLCEYHFGDEEDEDGGEGADPAAEAARKKRQEAKGLVDFIRVGTGYLDRANDLEALVDIYEAHAEVVSTDARRYRKTDVARARRLADSLYRALGEGNDGDGKWMAAQTGLWPLLLKSWLDVQRVGRFLAPMGQGEGLFPSLVTAARARAPRSSKPGVEAAPTEAGEESVGGDGAAVATKEG